MGKWRRARPFKVGKQKWEWSGGKWQPILREENILREIVERLWLEAKIKVWRVRERIPGMGAPSTPGIPDLIGYIPRNALPKDLYNVAAITSGVTIMRCLAVPLFIEVKRPGGVRRIAQTRFIDEAVRGGCCAFFAESWDDCARELKTFCAGFVERTVEEL